MTDYDHHDLTRLVRTKIDLCDCGCWVWSGSTDSSGYAKVKMRNVTRGVHRYTYEQLVGEIPEGLTIDHLCDRHRNCVNPAHMETVTMSENSTRANHRRWSDEHRPEAPPCSLQSKEKPTINKETL